MHAALRQDDAEFGSRIENAIFRDIFAYWLDKRGARAMPARADIEPMEIPRLLRHVYLLDVVAAPRDYRFRLIGTAIVERYGDDHTGKPIGEVFPEPTLSLARRIFGTVVEERRPVRASGPVVWRRDGHVTFECVYLPLADNARDVNMIFGGMIYESRYTPGVVPPGIVFE